MTARKFEAREAVVGQHVLTNDGCYGEVLAVHPIPTGYLNIRLLVTKIGRKALRRPMRMTHTIRRDGSLYIKETA